MIGAGTAGRNSRHASAAGVSGWAVLAVLLALLALVTRHSTRFVVRGESMLPALRPGDYVLATAPPKWVDAPWRGWVVVARRPDRPELELIKRVTGPAAPGNSLIVRGDNPRSSTDSRSFGPVPRTDLIGLVWLRYWPPTRIGLVRPQDRLDRS